MTTCKSSATNTANEFNNLKYYTWVEQQGKTFEEIQAQWYDPEYWLEVQSQVPEIDARIEEFNRAAAE